MKLLNWYLQNYRVWKRFKKFPKVVQQVGRWPSETYNKYPPYYDFDGLKVLNFGCGKSIYQFENVTNVDVVPGKGICVIDPSKSLTQFGQDFDHIIANHVLEHVPLWFDTFKEMAEIVKPGGIIEIWVPPVSSDTAFTYRDHLNRIGLNSFAGTASFASAGANALVEHQFKELGAVKDLELIEYGKRPVIRWWTMLAWPTLLEFITTHLRNTVSEEKFVFRKRICR